MGVATALGVESTQVVVTDVATVADRRAMRRLSEEALKVDFAVTIDENGNANEQLTAIETAVSKNVHPGNMPNQ